LAVSNTSGVTSFAGISDIKVLFHPTVMFNIGAAQIVAIEETS